MMTKPTKIETGLNYLCYLMVFIRIVFLSLHPPESVRELISLSCPLLIIAMLTTVRIPESKVKACLIIAYSMVGLLSVVNNGFPTAVLSWAAVHIVLYVIIIIFALIFYRQYSATQGRMREAVR